MFRKDCGTNCNGRSRRSRWRHLCWMLASSQSTVVGARSSSVRQLTCVSGAPTTSALTRTSCSELKLRHHLDGWNFAMTFRTVNFSFSFSSPQFTFSLLSCCLPVTDYQIVFFLCYQINPHQFSFSSWLKNKPTRQLKHTSSVLEYFEYCCRMMFTRCLLGLDFWATISALCAWLSCSNLYCTILILVHCFWAN